MESLIAEEYESLRESVRALATKKIAPFAHEVDEQARFPQEAADALKAAGLFAAHVPAEFGGDGADALATVIIIEEVARVCGSSSLIPAVNKLGSVPLILGGSQEPKARPIRRKNIYRYSLKVKDFPTASLRVLLVLMRPR